MRQKSLERVAFSLIELLVVIAIIGILVSLMLPAVQMTREGARKTQCTDNLRQIGIGFQNCEQAKGHYPGGGWHRRWVGVADRGIGKDQPGGWLYQLLPYIEQTALFNLGSDGNAIDKNPKSVDGVYQAKRIAGAERSKTTVSTYTCASRRPCRCWPRGGRFTPMFGTVGGNNHPKEFFTADYAANGGDLCVDPPGGLNDDLRRKIWGSRLKMDEPKSLLVGDQWTKNERSGDAVSKPAGQKWPVLDPPPPGAVHFRSTVTTASITDGTSNTYLVGEKFMMPTFYEGGYTNLLGDAIPWCTGCAPDNIRFTYYEFDPADRKDRTKWITPYQPILDTDTPTIYPQYNKAAISWAQFGSAHPNGFNMVFCDGSVHTIPFTIDPETHRRLGNRQDRQQVEKSEFQ